MIDWRKSYRLGIPEIDGEHLVLLALLNQIEMDHIFETDAKFALFMAGQAKAAATADARTEMAAD